MLLTADLAESLETKKIPGSWFPGDRERKQILYNICAVLYNFYCGTDSSSSLHLFFFSFMVITLSFIYIKKIYVPSVPQWLVDYFLLLTFNCCLLDPWGEKFPEVTAHWLTSKLLNSLCEQVQMLPNGLTFRSLAFHPKGSRGEWKLPCDKNQMCWVSRSRAGEDLAMSAMSGNDTQNLTSLTLDCRLAGEWGTGIGHDELCFKVANGFSELLQKVPFEKVYIPMVD